MQAQVKEGENHHKTLEERASEFEGKLMLDGEYDWGKPVGKEVWYGLTVLIYE